MEDNPKGSTVISCQRCRFYKVTWDQNLPYGCVAHGFKSRKNPALAVYESSGMQCQLFSLKSGKK